MNSKKQRRKRQFNEHAKFLFKGLNAYEQSRTFSIIFLQVLHLNHESMQMHMSVCVSMLVSVCVFVRERKSH